MNPNFVKSQADKNGIRNEYLKNLQLETSNNLMNYNANQIFKQTGILPPSITALVDTRSITEKYADKQKARVAVLSGLREITDGANANQIIDQIHGNDIIDLLNNLPQIITDIKPKWSLGITAPAFLGYWNRYKQALSANAGVSTLPILQSNQILTSIKGLLQNIQSTIATKEQYDALDKILGDLTETQQSILAKKMNSRIRDLTASFIEEAERVELINDPIVQEQQTALLSEIASFLPSQLRTQSLINQGQIAIAIDNTPTMSNEFGTATLSIQQPAVDMIGGLPVAQSPQEALEQFEKMGTPSSRGTATTKETRFSQEEEEEEGESPSAMSDITTETFKETPVKQLPPVYSTTRNYEQFKRLNWLDKKIFISIALSKNYILKSKVNYGEVRNFSALRKKNLEKTNLPQLVEGLFERIEKRREEQRQLKRMGGQQESKQTQEAEEEGVEPTAEDIRKATTGSGIRKVGRPRIMGRGVATAVAVYTKKPKVDTSHKVERVPSYIEFGKHLLHQHNLLGGILQIRRRSGNIINELPRQAIGGNLKKILITLTGTGSPSFEDINELSTHEKELLNKVVKHCKIDQRLLVPTPNKTKEEQDMNRLKILSGEITAGNNNPTIVKELKTLLLRLKNSGRIPKREAHEIMEDLLTLGY